MWLSVSELEINVELMLNAFSEYNRHDNTVITRALFERNLSEKMHNRHFYSDVSALLATGASWSPKKAYEFVMDSVIAKLPGDPWKGIDQNSRVLQETE